MGPGGGELEYWGPICPGGGLKLGPPKFGGGLGRMLGGAVPAGPPFINSVPADGAEFVNGGSGDGTGGRICCGPKCVVGADLDADKFMGGGGRCAPFCTAACIGMGATI